jgi:hypothetical protein
VNEQCQADPNGIPKAMGLWLDFMINFHAKISGPFGVVVDIPWVGKKLDPSHQDYLWKKTLAGICGPDADMRWFENKLNEKFKTIFASMNGETREEYDEFSPPIGPHSAISPLPPPPVATDPGVVTVTQQSAATNPGIVTVTQQRGTVEAPNPITTESEDWRTGMNPVTITIGLDSNTSHTTPLSTLTLEANSETYYLTEGAEQPPVVTVLAIPTEAAQPPFIVTVTQLTLLMLFYLDIFNDVCSALDAAGCGALERGISSSILRRTVKDTKESRLGIMNGLSHGVLGSYYWTTLLFD